MKPQVHVMTQETVDELLSLNTNNRKLRKRHVTWLAEMFRRGEYVPTHQAIGVSVSGRLIDGQHRLEALKEAGYPPVEMLIVTNLDDRAASVIDIGLKRTMADIFSFVFSRPDLTASVLACCRFIGALRVDQASGNWKPSPAEMLSLSEEFGEQIQEVLGAPGLGRLPAPVVAAAVEIMKETGDDRSVLFLMRVVKGVGLKENSPELALHRYFVKVHGSLGAQEVQYERYVKTKKALNAHLAGLTVGVLRGKNRAKFLFRTSLDTNGEQHE